MPLAPAIPVLRIFSVDKAKEFYLDFMGFQLDWEHRFSPDLPLYAQIHRDGLILHLSEHHGDASPGANIRIAYTGLASFQQQLLTKHYRNAKPGLETMPWGMVEMRIADPFGNRLVFFEELQEMPVRD